MDSDIPQPKPGDTVYLANCQRAEYISPVSGGRHLVYPDIEVTGYEGGWETQSGDATVVDRVFLTRPRAALDEEVAALNAQAAELKAAITAHRSEALTARREADEELKKVNELMGRLSRRSPALLRLEEFLDGKITHYVAIGEYSGEITIETRGNPYKPSSYHGKRDCTDKLLTLYGTSEGNLEWRLGRYTEPSDRDHGVEVIPCLSEGQAKVVVRQQIEEGFKTEAIRPTQNRLDGLIKSAQKYGVTIPDSARRALAKRELADAQFRLDNARSSAASAEEAVALARQKMDAVPA